MKFWPTFHRFVKTLQSHPRLVALAVWIIRRRHGGTAIEPATATARKDP